MKLKSTVVLLVSLCLGVLPLSGQLFHPSFSTASPEADLLAISEDGQLGAWSAGQQLLVFDLTSGYPVGQPSGVPADITFLAFDEQNDWLVAAAPREVVRWRLSDFRIKERFVLPLQPEGETAAGPSRYMYDDARELLFRSVGSDLFCYSLQQKGQGKHLKLRRSNGKEVPPRPVQLLQAPKQEFLWILDPEQEEIKVVELDYFRVHRRLSVSGAVAMAVDNHRVAVLCRIEDRYRLEYLDREGRPVASFPLPVQLPGRDTLKMAFTGRRMLSISGYRQVWDLSLETGRLSPFEMGKSYRRLFFLPDGKLAIWKESGLQLISNSGRVLRRHQLPFGPLLLHDPAGDRNFLLERDALRDEAGDQHLKLHPDDAFASAASVVGDQFVLSGHNGSLTMYDLDSGARRCLLADHQYAFARLQLLPEDGLVAAWSYLEDAVLLIDLEEGKVRSRLRAVGGRITAMTIRRGRLFLGDESGGVAVYAVSDAPLLEDYHHLAEEPIEALAFSPDGKWALAGGQSGVFVCRMPCMEVLHRRPGHDNAVRGFRFHSSEMNFLSLAEDGVVKEWELPSGQLLESISPEGEDLWDAQYLGNRRDMLLLSSRGRLLVRRSDIGIRGMDASAEENSRGVEAGPLQTAMSPDGALTAVLPPASGAITIWDNASGTALQQIPVSGRREAKAISFWERQPILVVSTASTIEYWDAQSGRLLKTINYQAANPRLLNLQKEPRSHSLWAIASGGAELLRLDAWTGAVLRRTQLPHPDNDLPEQFSCLAVSTHGGRLALRGGAGLYIYDTRSEDPQAFIRHARAAGEQESMALSPDGHFLALILPGKGEVIVFDLLRESLFFKAPGEQAVFLDDRRMAVLRNEAERGASVDIWDYIYGGPLGTVQMPFQRRLQALEAQRGLLLTVDGDGHLKYWEGQSFRRPTTGAAAPAYELVERFPLRPGRPHHTVGVKPVFDWEAPPAAIVEQEKEKINPALSIKCRVTKSTSLRTGAGAKHRVLRRLHDGDLVEIVEETDNPYWVKVRFRDRTGWAKKALLRKMTGH